MPLADYVHSFVAARVQTSHAPPPLLLLPRTGGTEATLIEFAHQLSGNSALLSLRGNVLENDQPRFFKRLARGQFDLDDFRVRTLQLKEFVAEARNAYGIAAPVAVGHSNGANIAWSLIMADPGALAGAILFRPLMPLDPGWTARADGFPVLVLSGSDDTIATPTDAKILPAKLSSIGARVTFEVVSAGHDLVADDQAVARRWLATNYDA